MNSLPVRLFLSTAKVISHPWFKTVSQYSTSVLKSTRKTRRGRKAGRNIFWSIRTVVTTNRALCAYQSSGRTSTHSKLMLITLQCSSKVTVDSIDTLPIKTLIHPRPKDNTQDTFIRVSSNLRKIPRISISQSIDRISHFTQCQIRKEEIDVDLWSYAIE
jgi:hypothetical protein